MCIAMTLRRGPRPSVHVRARPPPDCSCRLIRERIGVLDLSHRADVGIVKARLAAIEARP
jgi:hypothetical protein